MNHWTWRLLIVLLAPVLLVQGRYTRAVTPRLPEPEGPRAGQAGHGPPLRLLIAGDSAAAGVGVDHQQQALAGQLVAALAPHCELHWTLLARTGTTTQDLLEWLGSEAPQPFDAVLLSLGVNDVTGTVRTRTWLDRQRALLALLRGRFGARQVLLTCVPPMEAFHALPQPLRRLLGARARHFNTALAQGLRDWPEAHGCELLRVAAPTQGDGLASDGFHPEAATYRLWANAAAQRIIARATGSGTLPLR